MPGPRPEVSARRGVAAAAVLAVALLAVLAIAQWAGLDAAPFEPGAPADVTALAREAGLQVCSERAEPDPLANQSIASATSEIAVTCPGPTARVVVDRYADVHARDATARELTARARPRGSGVVWAWKDMTVLVQGRGDDVVRTRLGAALQAAGAR